MKNFNYKPLLREITVKKSVIIFALLAALISVFTNISTPALIGQTIDDIGDNGSTLSSVILLAILVIISAISGYVLQRFAYKIAYETAASLRLKAEKKLNALSISKLDRTAKGDLINTVSVDTEILSDGIIQGVLQFITGILTVLGTIIIMLAINYRLALVVIIITPLSLLTAKLITGRSKREFAAQSALRAGITAHADEWIGGQRVVMAFNMENESISRFSALNEKLRKVGFKAQLFSALVNPTTRFVNGLVYAFTGLVGLLLILGVIPGGNGANAVTVGVLAAFLSYANQYTKPFNEISATYAELQNALSSAKRIFTLLNEPEEDNSETDEYIPMKDSFEVSHLDFSYNENKKILQDINFKLKNGENIAVVGPTGCGKTTLINLLERFYEPLSGEISSDGENIAKYSKPSLRENISMVLQDSFIFNDTILENIRYGTPEATEKQAAEAARIVGAHSFIKRLPDGYDTVISGNRELSAGQKQLLSLSRVMLANMIKPASLLILDEATSNIDTVTERKIKKAVKILTEGRTSIIIAHRLSTIKDSDMIIVIDGGKIVETGTHDSLINADGVYENMYKA
ncbi:MAG: ABC transporter ATP-binding protein/permease [Ruminococcus sp.]|jgi:ATP-binding cassette subfamily B protein|nr:ABC transporter ATP-binding protein/permease [Ruminococcus sp.]